MEFFFCLRIMRKKGTDFIGHTETLCGLEEKLEGQGRSWNIQWPFLCKQTAYPTQNLVITMTIARCEGKHRNTMNYTFPVIFSSGDFLILMWFVYLMVLNTSLFQLLVQSFLWHVKILYPKQFWKGIIVKFAFPYCDPVLYQLHFMVLFS